MDGLLPFFCMCHPSFLIYIQIISFSFVCSSVSCPLSLSTPFSFVHQSGVHYLFPFHSKCLIFFCLLISCPLSPSIPFEVSHFLWFINLMSIISFHSIQSISLFFCLSISCPLSLSITFKLSNFLLFINLMSIVSGTCTPCK